MTPDSFPCQQARTRNFNLGAPGSFQVSADGSRVTFIRSKAGDDPVACLWTLDVGTGDERLVFDPAAVGGDAEAHLSQDEIDRRERVGEKHAGVASFATDDAGRTAAFTLGERLLVADLETGDARELPTPGEPFDPRPDPTGRRVAYVSCGTLRVFELETGRDEELATDPDPDVHWGVAEFVAAEEMDRGRGFWWSPDGERIAATCVDERPVAIRYIASPIDPATKPRAVRYPEAGGANAIVTLSVLSLDGSRVDVEWDVDAFPYLVTVACGSHGPLTLLVQSRDQRMQQVLAADPETGGTKLVAEDRDEHWLEVVPGVPAWLPGGRLLMTRDLDDTRRLTIDGEPISPAGLQVHHVVDAGEEIVFAATDDPTQMHLWRMPFSGGEPQRITTDPGVHGGEASAGVVVLVSSTLEEPLPTFAVTRDGAVASRVASFAERPMLDARPTFFTVGERELRCALLVPGGEEPAEPIPVLLDPYGGPHGSRVVRSHRAFLESQWWADQGFAVLVADGRGTPNRGPAWERTIHYDVAEQVLQDQVDAVQGTALRFGFLDLDRVAMRGWSFGGYLTCLAVLRRPDVFHAGVAGAPSIDWALYDTFYTERYVGTPQEHPDVYRRTSVLDDAPKLARPLMLVHGLSDDNVYVANTLALSKALTEAGRPHTVLPLSGITHRPVDEHVAENLLLLEARFLKDALAMT
ncbi:MAG TPA: prolyl oligopeptidase family serine peptidase [Actinomycetota bacterium]|nr:prolyl oligopeptidase family serine peptidase [Actinomycetota bacterium]